MSRLTEVISYRHGGVFATSLPKQDLVDGLTQPGVVFFDIDGSKLRTATQFLGALGEQLNVPDLAEAEDWDYLDERLVDLDEFPAAGSFVILFDQFQHLARTEPAKWETIVSVFGHAVKAGRSRQKPMFVFLRGEPLPTGLPVIDQA